MRKEAGSKSKQRKESSGHQVRQHTKNYGPDDNKALRACGITFCLLAFFSTLLVAYPCWPFAVLLGCTIVRDFIVFHDASHGSLMASRGSNQLVAGFAGPWISRTAAGWSASHNHHHKVIGSDPPPAAFPNQILAGRDCGYDDSRTVLFSLQEYSSWPIWKKAGSRIFRDPFFFFGAVVPLQWLYRPEEWPALAKWLGINVAFYFFGGFYSWLLFILANWVALVLAGLLFHLQHQVNPGYWKRGEAHDHDDACLKGCSYLHVPWVLKWVTLGIEYHHIHHLSARVPCYELQRCHEACDPALFEGVVEVSMGKAFRSCFHAMWDEDKESYVSFDIYRWLGLEG